MVVGMEGGDMINVGLVNHVIVELFHLFVTGRLGLVRLGSWQDILGWWLLV